MLAEKVSPDSNEEIYTIPTFPSLIVPEQVRSCFGIVTFGGLVHLSCSVTSTL
jgi:hypothetical protein